MFKDSLILESKRLAQVTCTKMDHQNQQVLEHNLLDISNQLIPSSNAMLELAAIWWGPEKMHDNNKQNTMLIGRLFNCQTELWEGEEHQSPPIVWLCGEGPGSLDMPHAPCAGLMNFPLPHWLVLDEQLVNIFTSSLLQDITHNCKAGPEMSVGMVINPNQRRIWLGSG